MSGSHIQMDGEPSKSEARTTASRDVPADQEDQENGLEVTLHVYDIGKASRWANNFLLRHHGLGLYHAGIEVCGLEWSYQTLEDCWDDETLTGVFACEPGKNEDHVWKEKVSLGKTPLDSRGISLVIQGMSETWSAQSYHLTDKNCIHFTHMFAQSLLVADRFDWSILYGLAGYANSSPTLKPMADSLWGSIRGSLIRQHQEAMAEEERLRRLEEARASGEDTPRDLLIGKMGRGTEIFLPHGLGYKRFGCRGGWNGQPIRKRNSNSESQSNNDSYIVAGFDLSFR